MIVLDTNVLSELLRGVPADAVARWSQAQPAAELVTTAICQAEILYGVALLPAGRRRETLARAVAMIFDRTFAGRVLPFDSAAAPIYADIVASRRLRGRPIGQSDAQIAAVAVAHGAALATRNIADFADCGVTVIDPWSPVS
jgi:toxin FitB